MVSKSHEDTATYSNFFIMPMAFFSGTFFPVDRMPVVVKYVMYVLPLTHTNLLIRKVSFDHEGALSLAVLILYAAAFFTYGTYLIRNYSE
jgi:ABC-type multidrug transport system permease subunit